MTHLQKRGLCAAIAAIVAAVIGADARATIIYDPVVTVVGDGGVTTSGNGYTNTINEYANSTLNASPISSASYNSSATGTRLVTTASSTSEGMLSNNPGIVDNAAKGLPSASGYVFNGGYNATDATASVVTSGTNADRSFGSTVVSLSGLSGATVAITKTQATTYGNSNFRAVVGDNASTVFWGAGTMSSAAGTDGWRYIDSSSNVQLSTTNSTNVRTVEILGGQLFGSTGAGTTHGIWAIGTGTPTTAGQTATLLVADTGGTGLSPYEFVLIDDPNNAASTATTFGYDTAYMADDSTASAGGGIQKYTWNGTAWSLAYTLNGGLTTGIRGLAGQLDTDTNQVVLWASNAGGTTLYQVTDLGSNGGSPFTTIATAPTNTVFRGVALAPIPEPASLTLLAGAALLNGLRRRR